MEELRLWLNFWKILGVLIVMVVGTISSCISVETYLVAEAVKNGVDPVAARCGIAGATSMRSDLCTISQLK